MSNSDVCGAVPTRRGRRRSSRDRLFLATIGLVAAFAAVLASAPSASAQTVTYRVNAGGAAVSATPTWTADTKSSPSPYVNAAETGNTTFSTTSTIDMTHASLPAGTPELLFKDDRFDKSGSPEMQWNFPVTAGTYEVRLYFAETYSGAMKIGGRKFDVSIEGSVKLNDYDIFAEVGGNKAVMKSFVVSSDANLDVDFGHVVENPTVSAIEILTSKSTVTPIGFGKSKLGGTSSTNPTSLQFGPDGRLYVAQQDGLIKAYTVSRNGANSYSVTATQTIDLVKKIPNHNDNGALNTNVTSRIITGILVTGTAANPVIYATSSDPRIGGGSNGSDLGLDTNSSMLSRLTWTGSGWQKVDLVRGLPRSEENHSANGLQLDPLSNTLYVAQGGNTNMGAPSNNFAYLPEFAFSAAILAIDLDAIGNTTYDLPTLDDESRAGNPDANDPFGGNDGKNQARLASTGPVQVHAPGFRNAYDLLRHSNGKMYTIDNGGNAGWGDVPVNEGAQGTCTNDPNEPGHTDNDTFHLIRAAGYGGHPNPTRGNSANTFNTTNPPGPQSPIETANKIECDYKTLPERGHLVEYPASTNGLTEYTASNFAGAMKGDILAASFDNSIYRVKLNAEGATLLLAEKLFSAVDNHPLDVTAQGDGGAFPGTIWVGDHGSGAVTVFEPNDFGGGSGGGGCTGANDATLDDDGDGFTNSDEIANGTNPCSAADQPPDWDGDKVSNLNDPDDDNDGQPDTSDPFAIDANNGTSKTLPVTYTWDNDGSPSPGGLLGLGFTGLMTNGTSNYESLYDPNGMTAGGAAGVTTIDKVPAGDAFKASNSQQYGFQLGLKAPASETFTAHTRILSPFAGMTPQDFQSMGLFIGNGDQDNYVKLVTAANGGTGGIELVKEVAGATTKSIASVAMPGPDFVDLYLTVSPAASTVQASYAVTSGGVTGPVVNLAAAQSIPSGWLTSTTSGLAVGIISTSTGPGPEFPATWDFVKVQSGGPQGTGTTLPGTWEPRAASPTNRQEVSYVNVGGKLYLAGGGTQHEVYSPSTNSWATVAPLPAGVDHIQGVTVNGRIYYVGGLTSWPSPEVDTVYIYDPASNSFSQGTKMPRPRGAGGVAVHNGKIYYAGGLHGGVAVPWFDVYDPATNTWSQLPDMPTARDHFQAAVVNGKFYAIGGRNKDINATTSANQAFDFSTGSWQTGLAPLPTPRGGFAAAVLGDEILIIGGEGGGSTFGTVEAYNTTTNAWRTLKPMPTPRHGIQATVCNGGVYIAAGGKTQGGASPTNVHEVFFLSGATACSSTDTTAPTVTTVAPAAGATGVAVGSNAAATFSEAMDPATITTSTFTLAKQGTTTPVSATVTYDGASATATLNPGADLEPGVTYTATVKGGTGGVKDLAGNPLAQDKTWSFTTASSPSPSANGLAGDYYDNKDFTSLKLSRVDATINFNWGSGSPDPSIGANTFSVRWTGEVKADHAQNYTFYTTSNDGVRLWVNGQKLIDNWTDHAATENSGTISLQAGQWYPITLEYYEGTGSAVISLSYSSASTPKQIVPEDHLRPNQPTDTTAPTVTTVAPAAGATGVAVGSNATATFSEAMDPATITTSTFTLAKQGTTTPVSATVTYDGASATATLNPGADLEPGVTYTATVKGGTGGVKDLAGNPLAQDKTWSFTTASSTSSPLASDTFSRVATGGWGTADAGGAWSLLSGSSSNFSVDGSAGTIQTPTGSIQQLVHLGSMSARDVDLAFEVTFPTTVSGTGGVFAYGVLRRQSGGAYYRIGVFVDAAGKVWIRGQNHAGTALFPDVNTGLSHVGATTYVVRLQTAGTSPTTIRAKAWKATESEPAAWATEQTDGTLGPQTAGSIGIRTISTSSTAMALAFDDLVATQATLP